VAGAGLTASFNYFHVRAFLSKSELPASSNAASTQRDMPAAKRRRLNQLQGARALWSIRVPVRGGGAVPERDTMLVVDENHASGHTKVCVVMVLFCLLFCTNEVFTFADLLEGDTQRPWSPERRTSNSAPNPGRDDYSWVVLPKDLPRSRHEVEREPYRGR
jgi:hypothetical protein